MNIQEIIDYLRTHCHVPIPNQKQIEIALEFLARYDFINYFPQDNVYVLRDKVSNFLQEVKKVETS